MERVRSKDATLPLLAGFFESRDQFGPRSDTHCAVRNVVVSVDEVTYICDRRPEFGLKYLGTHSLSGNVCYCTRHLYSRDRPAMTWCHLVVDTRLSRTQ